MEVQIGRFTLCSSDISKERFDVKLNVLREKQVLVESTTGSKKKAVQKTGETYEDESVIAWSQTMKQSLKIIIGYSLASIEEKDSCEKYLELYDKGIDKLDVVANKLLDYNIKNYVSNNNQEEDGI